MTLFEWWQTLALSVQIFYCIAIPATLVLLIQTVMMLFGIDDGEADLDGDLGDVDFDGDTDIDDGIFGDDVDMGDDLDVSALDSLHIFTLRGIIAFFVVFGWVGVAMQSKGIHLLITLAVAFVCGALMMVLIAYMFRGVMRLRQSGTVDNRNAIGAAGKVYLTIPPERTGEGKVNIMLQGSYVEKNAVTDESEPIPTGSEIIVVGVSGGTTLVVKRK